MIEPVSVVTRESLIDDARAMLTDGARFCTATCSDVDGRFDVIYHFEMKNGDFQHLRLKIPRTDTLPSLSGVYLCATLIENEMAELFGIRIENRALDYSGHMLVTDGTPQNYLLKPPDYTLKPRTYLSTPCRRACPAGVDIPTYVRLAGEGQFDAALAVLKQAVPFPGVLGRVCLAPCETACRQAKQGEAIAIRALKRAAYERGSYREPSPSASGKRVAIIGAGPAGLSAAYYLARLGHAVTIFEAMTAAGGYMRSGIPAMELPRAVLDDEINAIVRLGVEIRPGERIDTLDQLEGYDAVLLACGAHQGVRRAALVAAMAGTADTLKQFGLETRNAGNNSIVEVDSESLATSRQGVFAAGDMTTGPSSVVHAIASGKKAALSIDKYLSGLGEWPERVMQSPLPVSRDTFIERNQDKSRPSVELSPEDSIRLNEEEIGLDRALSMAEGQRCWRCDLEE